MFDYAQQRALEVLGTPHIAVLVTNGPAGIQICEFVCALSGLSLYLLVPQTSDHLFNLEHAATVALLINRCDVKGSAQIIPRAAVEPDCVLWREAEAEWCALLRVKISQVQLQSEAGWGHQDTIDL